MRHVLGKIRAFARSERAEGTTGGGIRIAIWALASLALIGFFGVKVVYPMLTKGSNCATAASGMTTANFTGGTAGGPTAPNC